MKDIIIFSGAPGSGKTTVAKLLRQHTKSPLIDFGDLRAWHLDDMWSDANAEEEAMAFENLIYVIKNYLKHGYGNILITDLKDDKVMELAKLMENSLVITLTLAGDVELERRITGRTDSGFKNVPEAIARNKKIKERDPLPNELRIDNTHTSPEKSVSEILNSGCI